MKKYFYLLTVLLILGVGSLTAKSTLALSISDKLKGKILLQVELKGEAWYVSPADGKRYSLGRPNDAFNLMRSLGIGISNDNLVKIKIANENLIGIDSDNDGLSDMAEDSFGTNKNNQDSDNDGYNDRDEIINGYNPNGSSKLDLDNTFAKSQSGKILLQVEKHGEAWYVNPDNYQRYFLGRPSDAFSLMRKLGLGITNSDLASIEQSINSDDLWGIYDKVNLALKNKDAASYNAYSYVQVTPDQESQFVSLASFMYEWGVNVSINKADYINKWQDDKQAIYSTNPKKMDDAKIYRYSQGFVMFIKKDSSWKVLMIIPEQGWSISKKGTNMTAAQAEQTLQTMILDSDKV